MTRKKVPGRCPGEAFYGQPKRAQTVVYMGYKETLR